MNTRRILNDLRITQLPAVEAFMLETLDGLPGGGGILGEMAAYHLDTGGERLRALIPLATYEAFGGHPEDAVPVAAACELLHNAVLVHDDVQDRDRTRRGSPAVWARWGVAQAINLGDAMLAWAGACVAATPSDDHLRCRLTGMLHFTMAAIAAGQVEDVDLQRGKSPTPEAWCDVAEAKTGALFGLCLAAPATLAGAAEDVHRALLGAARHLSIIFQIQNDLSDLYGTEGREAPRGDLREGKMTLPVIHALHLAGASDRERLQALLGTPREDCPDDTVRWAGDLFRELGVVDACLEEVLRRQRDLSQASILDDQASVAVLVRGLGEVFTEALRL